MRIEDLGFEREVIESSSEDEKVIELENPMVAGGLQELETLSYENQAFNTDEVKKAAKESLDFLAAMAMPSVFKYFFPDTFKAIWNWLILHAHKVRDFSQLAIGLPRGFGKTMVIKIFILYCLLFTQKKFILILCGTAAKANNIITDVMNMLGDQNMKCVFGDWKIGVETDRQDLKRFGFRGRNVIVMGAGAGGDIRGITLENIRPDVIIFDDIQTRDDADSEVVSGNLETWMTGTAMKAKSPEGCLFIFIANMYPTKHSILRKLKTNPTWDKVIVGGILRDGTSLWEDLQPIKQLLKEYQNDLAMGHPEIFFSEVLNDENASVNRFINVDLIPDNPYEHDTQHQGNFIVIDPSNDKNNSDNVCIGYFELFDSHPVLKEIVEGRLSPSETIEQAIKLCLIKNCRVVCIESVAFQYSLLHWSNKTTAEMGVIGIQFLEVYPGVISKNSRILTMFKGLVSKRLVEGGNKEVPCEPEQYISSKVRALVLSYITSFNPLKTNNVDGVLDLLTYSTKVVELYGEYILSGLTIEMQEFESIKILGAEETCSF